MKLFLFREIGFLVLNIMYPMTLDMTDLRVKLSVKGCVIVILIVALNTRSDIVKNRGLRS